MGRQIAVVLDPEDEPALEQFLRTCGSVELMRSFAATRGGLVVPSLLAAEDEHCLDVYCRDYDWAPEFKQTETEKKLWYVANKGVAPCVEYTRARDTQFGGCTRTQVGRLYWGDRFSGEPAYDRVAFGGLVDRIWRWVRREAKRDHALDAWCFPAAARRLNTAEDSKRGQVPDRPAREQ